VSKKCGSNDIKWIGLSCAYIGHPMHTLCGNTEIAVFCWLASSLRSLPQDVQPTAIHESPPPFAAHSMHSRGANTRTHTYPHTRTHTQRHTYANTNTHTDAHTHTHIMLLEAGICERVIGEHKLNQQLEVNCTKKKYLGRCRLDTVQTA